MYVRVFTSLKAQNYFRRILPWMKWIFPGVRLFSWRDQQQSLDQNDCTNLISTLQELEISSVDEANKERWISNTAISVSQERFATNLRECKISDFTFWWLIGGFSATVITNLDTANLFNCRLFFPKILTLPFVKIDLETFKCSLRRSFLYYFRNWTSFP